MTQHDRIDPYANSTEQVWSGNPNQALVDLVSGLTQGTAVDVGAGEGADSAWLAQQGWTVTAIEPSETAAARIPHGAVTVVNRTLEDADLPAESFDLVASFYPALFRTPDNTAQRALTRLVAPGGILLIVSHADVDVERALAHGFNPADYIDHEAMLAFLSDDDTSWDILLNERRARSVSGGGGAHHHEDLILMARKK